MLPIRSKEEARALVKEFTKEHKEFLEDMIKKLDKNRGLLSCCPVGSYCYKCPFNISNSTKNRPCGNEENVFGVCISAYDDNVDTLIAYINEIIRLCYDENKTKTLKYYTIIEDNYVKKYTLTDKVKRREMVYGEILFTNISFIVNGGVIIIINENKTGGVVYGKKAKKYFRKLSKNNLNYNIKSIKHLSDNGIEQISFSIEENKKALDNNIYNI